MEKEETTMKTCSTCKEIKELDQFYKYKNRQQHHCKKCHIEYSKKYIEKNRDKVKERLKNYYKTNYSKIKIKQKHTELKRIYGITLNEYNQLLKEQNDSCFICQKHQSNFKRKLAVDHDHKTGKVRGLLCHNCNTSLGKFNDDTIVLKRAIEYLEKKS